MKYLEHIQKFWEFNQREPIGVSSITLYLFLLNNWYSNETSVFILSDGFISKNIGITIRSIKKIKVNLKNLGLIDFYTKNGVSTQYTILDASKGVSIEVEKQVKIETIKKLPSKPKVKSEKLSIPIDASTPPQLEIVNPNIPSEIEFIEYAESLVNFQDNMIDPLKLLYQDIVSNGWRNSYDRPIINWQMFIKKQLPFMNNTSTSKSSLQTINRPQK